MSVDELLSWRTLLLALGVALVVGGIMPVLAVRCVVLLYPKGHSRRDELVGEMARVEGIVERWVWLGGTLATAVCEGLPEHRRARSTAQRRRQRIPVLGLLLRGYRTAISPLYGDVCRFEPSCSAYALEAVELHGTAKGGWLMIRRLGRCHPWGGSGADPVPGHPQTVQR